MILNLIIDVGNTQIKIAVFNRGELQMKEFCSNSTFIRVIKKLQEKFPDLKNAIISSVGSFNTENITWTTTRFKTLFLSSQLKLPFTNKYATPDTLGVDRIALVSAAVLKYPNKNCLIIDAGSCITYDFISANGEYYGGAISPGIKMRYQALHTFTDKLPLLSINNEKKYIGNTTQSSINIGVLQGVLFEIEGYIARYNEDFKDLTVILTGGDTYYLLDSLNFNIFANSNFLLEGLNHILEHNLY